MIDQIGYWVLVALGFGFLIFIHELGHFLAAKFVGIRIIRFAIGFGPRLFGTNKSVDHKDHDKRVPGTDYCLCLIPCGGYVKMAGGEGEAESEMTGALDEYPSKTPGQRALVIAAGPFMSIVTAVPLLFFLLLVGMERPSSRINAVLPLMPAWETGLMRGDRITGFRAKGEEDWREVRLWREVEFNSALMDKVGEIQVRFERDGIEHVVDLRTRKNGILGVAAQIVGTYRGYMTNIVGKVSRKSAAYKAGIRSGCTLLEIGGRQVRKWSDLEDVVRRSAGKTLSVKFKTPEGDVRTSTIKIGKEEYKGLDIVASRPSVIATKRAPDTTKAKDGDGEPEEAKSFLPVRPGFPAEKAGMKKGDAITNFNGLAVENWPKLRRAFAIRARIGTNTLTVVRDGKTSRIEVELTKLDNIYDGLGIAPEELPIVEKGAPGIPVGAKLLKFVNPDSKRKPVPLNGLDNVGLIEWRVGKSNSLAVTFEHNGEKRTVNVPMVSRTKGKLELDPQLESVYVLEPWRPVAAVGQAFVEAGTWMKFAARGLWLLVTGQLSMDKMSGPVMILTATKYQAVQGFSDFIEFLVIITIHLGVINLVPFPILDGGHLAFLAVEKIRRKPCPEKLMAGLMYGGMVALLALMLFVTWNDVSKIVNIFGG